MRLCAAACVWAAGGRGGGARAAPGAGSRSYTRDASFLIETQIQLYAFVSPRERVAAMWVCVSSGGRAETDEATAETGERGVWVHAVSTYASTKYGTKTCFMLKRQSLKTTKLDICNLVSSSTTTSRRNRKTKSDLH